MSYYFINIYKANGKWEKNGDTLITEEPLEKYTEISIHEEDYPLMTKERLGELVQQVISKEK